MSKQTINVGTSGNSGTGDSIRTAFTAVNNNFTELYGLIGSGTGVIGFSSLADAPASYTADQLIMASHTNPQELTARTIVANGLTIDKTDDTQITFTVVQNVLKDENIPTLSAPLDAESNPFGRLVDPSAASAAIFNASRGGLVTPVTTKISEMPVTVNYGMLNYVAGVADSITGTDTSSTQRSAGKYTISSQLVINGGINDSSTTSTAYFAEIFTNAISTKNTSLTIGKTTGTTPITISSGSGDINIGTDTTAKALYIGNSTSTTRVDINSGTAGTTLNSRGDISIGTDPYAKAISIGNTTGDTSVNINSGTGAINIGTAIAKTITVGNTAASTTVNINSGTGGNLYIGGGGSIAIGAAVQNNILIGNSVGSTTVTIRSGTGDIRIGNDTTVKKVYIGSTYGTSSVVVNGGTGGVELGTNSVEQGIIIGNNTGSSSVTIHSGTGGIDIGTGSSSNTPAINIGDLSTIVTVNGTLDITADTTTTKQITSTVADGTPPFVVTSTTPVDNLSIGGTAGNVSGIVGISNGGTGSAYGATSKIEDISVYIDPTTNAMTISLADTALDFIDASTGGVEKNVSVTGLSLNIPSRTYIGQNTNDPASRRVAILVIRDGSVNRLAMTTWDTDCFSRTTISATPITDLVIPKSTSGFNGRLDSVTFNFRPMLTPPDGPNYFGSYQIPFNALLSTTINGTPTTAYVGTPVTDTVNIFEGIVYYNNRYFTNNVVGVSGNFGATADLIVKGNYAPNTVYSNATVTDKPFRIVGIIDMSYTSDGKWAAPSRVLGLSFVNHLNLPSVMNSGIGEFIVGVPNNSTSTLLNVSTGIKTFLTMESAATYLYRPGRRVHMTCSTPAATMEGIITSFTLNTMVVNVDTVSGSGTNAGPWSIAYTEGFTNSPLLQVPAWATEVRINFDKLSTNSVEVPAIGIYHASSANAIVNYSIANVDTAIITRKSSSSNQIQLVESIASDDYLSGYLTFKYTGYENTWGITGSVRETDDTTDNIYLINGTVILDTKQFFLDIDTLNTTATVYKRGTLTVKYS